MPDFRVPWLLAGSLPSPFTLYLLLLALLFSQHPSHVLRCSVLFLSSFHVYSLRLTAPIFLGPGHVQLKSIENVIPEVFILFSVSQSEQF